MCIQGFRYVFARYKLKREMYDFPINLRNVLVHPKETKSRRAQED